MVESPEPAGPTARRRRPRLHPIEASYLHARRERVFLVLAGTFIGAMAMLNVLGITKFVQLGPMSVAVGVLPYPLTFLCTDLIGELYGRGRAAWVVLTGLLINLLVLGFVWVGDALPSVERMTPDQRIVTFDYVELNDGDGTPLVDPITGRPIVVPAAPVRDGGDLVPIDAVELAPVPDGPVGSRRLVDAGTGEPIVREESLFDRIGRMTRQAVLASMIAYLVAQSVDVWLFHFWKRLTRGRWLWLRNNGSTVVSQFVDTTCVVLITFWAVIETGEMSLGTAAGFIRDGYVFKLLVALLDTLPFYVGAIWLARYMRIDPRSEHDADAEELVLDEPGGTIGPESSRS